MPETALVLVCKRPSWGTGKQRLAGFFGRETAERVATSLLACALEDCRAWPGPVIIAPARSEDRVWAEGLMKSAAVIPQEAGNLGHRLNVLDRSLRREGFVRLVYMGSDAPGLGKPDFDAARDALDRYDVAVAPAEDGGVVLMASRTPWPDLEGLPWSTGDLGLSLQDLCRSQGGSIETLAKGFDIDWPEDLLRAVSVLSSDSRPARQALLRLLFRLSGDSARAQEIKSGRSH